MTTQPETHVITDLESPKARLDKKKIAVLTVATLAIVGTVVFVKSKLTSETESTDETSA